MRTSLIAMLALTACGLGEEPAAPEAPAPDVPDQAALAFYCDAMFNLNPAVFMDVAPRERQGAVMDALTAQAAEANVGAWSEFQAKLGELEPKERQGWINRGVKTHGMEEACVAVRPRASLSEADQARLNEQRNKLRAAAKEAAQAEGTAEE